MFTLFLMAIYGLGTFATGVYIGWEIHKDYGEEVD